MELETVPNEPDEHEISEKACDRSRCNVVLTAGGTSSGTGGSRGRYVR